MTSPKRTTVAKTVTPPPDAVAATVPSPEADPFIPEFSGPSMTEDERSELAELRQFKAEAVAELNRQSADIASDGDVSEIMPPGAAYNETAKQPCPIHYPLGWDGVAEEHNSVGCEHGHFPRQRQIDHVKAIQAMPLYAGTHQRGSEVFGDPWALGQDV